MLSAGSTQVTYLFRKGIVTVLFPYSGAGTKLMKEWFCQDLTDGICFRHSAGFKQGYIETGQSAL